MIDVDSILALLKNVRRSRNGFTARCPGHNDHKNSLTIDVGDDGRILLHCFAGCSIEAICSSIGLHVRDLFDEQEVAVVGRATGPSITIADLAQDKCLPADFLESLGLENRPDGVVIPYQRIDGSLASRHRLRTALRAKDGSYWMFGKGKPVPYGLARLQEARDQGFLVVLEGESDCWTLWHHGFPALGIPGAALTSKIEAEHLKGIGLVYVCQESDKGGDRFVQGAVRTLGILRWKGSAYRLLLDGAKDPNELHQQNPDEFQTSFKAALERSEELTITEPSGNAPPTLDENAATLFKKTGVAVLAKTSTPQEIETALRALAAQLSNSDELKVALIRQAAIDQLKASDIPGAAKLVHAALKSRTADRSGHEGSGSTVLLESAEPWPEPVDGPRVVDAVANTLSRYVALPEHAADAIALWILHCYAFDATFVSPILAITSPEKRCGKTTLLEIIGALAPRVLMAANITSAALFRSVEKFHPTLLIDEADTFIAKHDEMRGLLNAGHYRSTAQVVRSVGDDNEPRIFSTWCPKAIALIGGLKGTLEDRSIKLSMRRRTSDETVERLRRGRIYGNLREVRQKIARWVEDHLDQLRDIEPAMVIGLHDRAQDNWRPLLALAEVIGGDWPGRAEAAALSLSGTCDEGDSAPKIQLLSDIRQVFIDRGEAHLASAELVQALVEMEDRPWGEWKNGKPLSAIGLSRLLKPFGVGPSQTHLKGVKFRGYALEQFEDVFARYLPSESGQRDNSLISNELDDNPESGQVGTVPSRVGTPPQQESSCPDSQSGCPDLVPTRLPFESGQPQPPAGADDRDEYDL